MVEFKFYREWQGDRYLQLHDNHTIWKIDKDFKWDDYEYEVEIALLRMSTRYKDLTIYQLGRSGRHICVEDTPINRRRYKNLVAYAEKLEQELIDYFNNVYNMED